MDDLENLEKLTRLRDKKIIDNVEFNSLKRSLIGKHINTHIGERSGTAYVLLAWFLGLFGAHNFYAGYTKRAIVQLLLTLFSGILFFLPLLVVQIWALADMCLIDEDADGVAFYGDRTLIRILRIAAIAFFVVMYFAGFFSTVVNPANMPELVAVPQV